MANEPKDAARCPSVKRILLRGVIAIVIGLIVALVLPKILGEEFITRKVARVVAPFLGADYVGAKVNEESNSPGIVTVVLIDDRDLKEGGEHWPARYAYFANLLNGLASYHPKAVFIDVIFSSMRDDTSFPKLEAALCAMHKGGIAVYVAAVRNDDDSLSVRKGSDNASWENCVTPVAVEFRDDEFDHMAWSYPMRTSEEGRTEPRSAALAIYQHTFNGRVPEPAYPLAMTWGLEPSSKGLLWSLPVSEEDNKGSHAKLAASGADTHGDEPTQYESYCHRCPWKPALISMGVWHALFPEESRPTCVFHQTLYVRELNNIDDPSADRMLKDHVVMVGSALKYSNDFVVSPLHDRIPGVYLHAMALDNLLMEGRQYPQAVHISFDSAPAHVQALVMLFFGLFSVFVLGLFKESFLEPRFKLSRCHGKPWSRHWIKHKSTDALKATFSKLLELALSAFLVALILVVGQKVFHIGYLTVVEICILALIPEWLDWSEKLVNWITDSKEKEHET